MRRMIDEVSRAESVPRGTRSGLGRRIGRLASGGMRGERGRMALAEAQLTARPGARRLDRLARTSVFGVPRLEDRQHVFGAICSPEGQRVVHLRLGTHRGSVSHADHSLSGAEPTALDTK